MTYPLVITRDTPRIKIMSPRVAMMLPPRQAELDSASQSFAILPRHAELDSASQSFAILPRHAELDSASQVLKTRP